LIETVQSNLERCVRFLTSTSPSDLCRPAGIDYLITDGNAASATRDNAAMMATMRAVVLTGTGPVENLELRDLPLPEPDPGWVRIAVKAFGLNRSELHLRLGLAEGVHLPIVPGNRGSRRRRRSTK